MKWTSVQRPIGRLYRELQHPLSNGSLTNTGVFGSTMKTWWFDNETWEKINSSAQTNAIQGVPRSRHQWVMKQVYGFRGGGKQMKAGLCALSRWIHRVEDARNTFFRVEKLIARLKDWMTMEQTSPAIRDAIFDALLYSIKSTRPGSHPETRY